MMTPETTPRNGRSDLAQECTLYLRNLDEKVNERLLEELFTQIGPVLSVNIKEQKPAPSVAGADAAARKPPTRYAFVEFADVESVLFACDIMDAVELFGQKLKVQPRDNTQQKSIYHQLGMEADSYARHRGMLPPPNPNNIGNNSFPGPSAKNGNVRRHHQQYQNSDSFRGKIPPPPQQQLYQQQFQQQQSRQFFGLDNGTVTTQQNRKYHHSPPKLIVTQHQQQRQDFFPDNQQYGTAPRHQQFASSAPPSAPSWYQPRADQVMRKVQHDGRYRSQPVQPNQQPRYHQQQTRKSASEDRRQHQQHYTYPQRQQHNSSGGGGWRDSSAPYSQQRPGSGGNRRR